MRGGMRNPMPEQPADVRNKNFKEVALGYDMKTAVDEAERCLHCPKPLCVSGCPVNVEIPAFIQAVKEGNMQEAIKILKRKNSLPNRQAAAYFCCTGSNTFSVKHFSCVLISAVPPYFSAVS